MCTNIVANKLELIEHELRSNRFTSKETAVCISKAEETIAANRLKDTVATK